MRLTVPLLVLSLFVAGGCGGSSGGGSVSIASGPAPVTSTAGGWKAYAPSAGGYRIEIPDGWATLDAASVADSSALSELTKANPDLQGAAAGFQQLASHPGALLAIDTTAGGKDQIRHHQFAANILVRRADLGSSAPDAKLLAAALKQGRSSAAALATITSPPRLSHPSIAGLPGGSLTYSFTVTSPSGVANPVTEADDIVVSQGVAYAISCTTLTADLTRLRPACEHALSSFTLTG
jgi:hypothetical protein